MSQHNNQLISQTEHPASSWTRRACHTAARFFMLGGLFIGLAVTQLAMAQSTAQAPTNTANPPPAADSLSSGHLLQTTLGLLFVLGLLLALAWVLKRAGFTAAQKRGGFYKVLATSSLGPREKIALIEVGNTWLVVGITAHSINTLHSLPAGGLDIGEAISPAVTFAKLLERVKTGKVGS
ncbi:flagellar biosynthetic protein FliO [Limnobacter humi]|uniref:Flagellar protein n=1 Tax=Limnobacter humi TaxID=1778671 RepID=A0ABT1WK14_9BURK|nr:flagellar biosynthetic protein FliO [Limnobacter humi]MCQ8897764.1 flagellar biosynthetic protein FliO [Limnobacter humi]